MWALNFRHLPSLDVITSALYLPINLPRNRTAGKKAKGRRQSFPPGNILPLKLLISFDIRVRCTLARGVSLDVLQSSFYHPHIHHFLGAA